MASLLPADHLVITSIDLLLMCSTWQLWMMQFLLLKGYLCNRTMACLHADLQGVQKPVRSTIVQLPACASLLLLLTTDGQITIAQCVHQASLTQLPLCTQDPQTMMNLENAMVAISLTLCLITGTIQSVQYCIAPAIWSSSMHHDMISLQGLGQTNNCCTFGHHDMISL